MRVINISTSLILSSALKECKPTKIEEKRMLKLYDDINSKITNISKNYYRTLK